MLSDKLYNCMQTSVDVAPVEKKNVNFHEDSEDGWYNKPGEIFNKPDRVENIWNTLINALDSLEELKSYQPVKPEKDENKSNDARLISNIFTKLVPDLETVAPTYESRLKKRQERLKKRQLRLEERQRKLDKLKSSEKPQLSPNTPVDPIAARLLEETQLILFVLGEDEKDDIDV